MKIAFLARSVPPGIDGVGEYTWHLARSLRACGVDAHIFTSTDQVGATRLEPWIHPVIPRWTGKAVVKAIASGPAFQPDWCCFQYVPQMYGHRGICWAASGVPQALRQSLKSRVATTFHEFASAGGPHLKDAVLAGVMRLQTGRLLVGSDLAITTCSRYADCLGPSAPRAMPVVSAPVGANIEPVPVQADEIVALRQRYSLDGSKVLGVFGRLSPFRNYPTAVRALELAKQQGLKTHLLLIGCVQASNPSLFAQLQRLARSLGVEAQMVVTGELSADAVSAHLRLVDVFLFPQCDGVSTRNTTVMTALAHGLPVVTYAPQSGNLDGYRIPYGALVPPGDEKGFIHTAVEFLGRIDDRSEGGNANAEYFEKHFSWSRIAEHYIGAFTAVGSNEYALRCGVRE